MYNLGGFVFSQRMGFYGMQQICFNLLAYNRNTLSYVRYKCEPITVRPLVVLYIIANVWNFTHTIFFLSEFAACVVHASGCSGLLTQKHACGGGRRISRICFLTTLRLGSLTDLEGLRCRYASWPVRPRNLPVSTSGAWGTGASTALGFYVSAVGLN